jgi:hypothetical protein
VYNGNRRVQDPLFGNRAMPGARPEFVVPGAGGAVVVKGLPDFVYTKGTAFVLYPGKTALAALSDSVYSLV